jgi:hypothetical protein
MTKPVPKPKGLPGPRNRDGTRPKGVSGRTGHDAGRARKALNAATIEAMHDAFRRGGREAIDRVMRNQPAVFLKLLVLLVPRELEIQHSGGVKGMSDEQLERGIEALEALLARRAGEGAKVIDVVPEQVALPAPSRKPRRQRGAEAKASLLPDGQGDSSSH